MKNSIRRAGAEISTRDLPNMKQEQKHSNTTFFGKIYSCNNTFNTPVYNRPQNIEPIWDEIIAVNKLRISVGNNALTHKAVPLHAMKALGGRGGIAPTHSRPRH
jgi:hypothetical protein